MQNQKHFLLIETEIEYNHIDRRIVNLILIKKTIVNLILIGEAIILRFIWEIRINT